MRDPTDVATGPAAGYPPVCQGTTFPLRRNGRIILYRAVWRKGGSAKNMKPAPFGAAGKMARPIQMPASTAKKRVRHDAFGFLK